MKDLQITFDYEDFNFTTNRNHDTRKHGNAEVKNSLNGEYYIYGAFGCGKIRPTIQEALKEYLGGRRLLAHKIFD